MLNQKPEPSKEQKAQEPLPWQQRAEIMNSAIYSLQVDNILQTKLPLNENKRVNVKKYLIPLRCQFSENKSRFVVVVDMNIYDMNIGYENARREGEV